MKRGVFCVEGSWYHKKLYKPDSVRPMLEMLRDDGWPCVHRDCGTSKDFDYYIGQWALKRYNMFPVLYLAFHGTEGTIKVGPDTLTLDDLSCMLFQKCKGRIILFGTCATLDASNKKLHELMHDTEATAICGYKQYVPWITATALELALLYTILKAKFTPDGIREMAKEMKRISRPFDLGFHVMTKYD